MKGNFEESSLSKQFFILAVIFLCCNLLAQFAISVFVMLCGISNISDHLQLLVFIQNSIIFIGTPLIAQYLFWKAPARRVLQLSKPARQPLLLGCLAILASIPAVDMLNTWNQEIHFPDGFQSLEQWMIVHERQAEETTRQLLDIDSWGGFAGNIVSVVLLAGIGEELLFRGVMQRMFIRWTHNIHLGIFLTAFIFSAIHLQFFGFVPRLVLGALLGYLYLLSRNLWIPIAAHSLNNFGVILFTPNKLNRNCEWIAKVSEIENNEWMALCSLLLTGILLYLVWKKSQTLLSSN